jgi:type II secretory pathway component GspD/PulD (secretin)
MQRKKRVGPVSPGAPIVPGTLHKSAPVSGGRTSSVDTDARQAYARSLFEAVAKSLDGFAGPARTSVVGRWRSRIEGGSAALTIMVACALLAAAQQPQGPIETDRAAAATAPPANASVPPLAGGSGANGLRLNFRAARLDQVLDYLSDAAGFVINKETDVKGTVDVWSKDAVGKDEAVELLNKILKKNGYAVIRNGRILTIISRDEAKTADLEVVTGSDPNTVQKSDEMVTQIIPVRYASVSQLMANLQPLLRRSANLTVNESANSLILVATKTDIKRMLKIVTALDTSIASVSSIKVFPLQYADAKDLATVIQQLFGSPTQGSTQSAAGNNPRAMLFNMFDQGAGDFGGRGGGAGTGSTGGAAATRVVAIGDDRSNSLIVSAPRDLLVTIADMVKKIDQPVTDVTELRVFRLINADPAELADQFTQLFPDETRTGSNQNQGPGGFFFGGGPGGAAATQSDTSERARKLGRILAVADQRTSSIIVAASKTLMPQIAEMVAELDSSRAKRERVAIYDLQNADPQDVQQVLQDLFNRNTYMRNNNAGNTQQNPLTTRQTQQQNKSGSSSSSGGSGGLSRTGF